MAGSHPYYKWCEVHDMCGRSLEQGVVYVGASALVLSIVSMILSLVNLALLLSSDTPLDQQPVQAVNLVFALICSPLSIYQMVISLLLLWQSKATKPNIFLCSLWYISHLSILTLYSMMFFARTVVCFVKKEYFAAIVTVIVGSAYEGTFVYFSIVVNSYIHSLDEVRYF
ncbi:hypothetical protein evm_004036 [Chilo suppressalis]|nr:hypothetical protein evm_004036 [Chilo suppressalis]